MFDGCSFICCLASQEKRCERCWRMNGLRRLMAAAPSLPNGSQAAVCAWALALSSGVNQKSAVISSGSAIHWLWLESQAPNLWHNPVRSVKHKKIISVCLIRSEILILWIVMPKVIRKGFIEGHTVFFTRVIQQQTSFPKVEDWKLLQATPLPPAKPMWQLLKAEQFLQTTPWLQGTRRKHSQSSRGFLPSSHELSWSRDVTPGTQWWPKSGSLSLSKIWKILIWCNPV